MRSLFQVTAAQGSCTDWERELHWRTVSATTGNKIIDWDRYGQPTDGGFGTLYNNWRLLGTTTVSRPCGSLSTCVAAKCCLTSYDKRVECLKKIDVCASQVMWDVINGAISGGQRQHLNGILIFLHDWNCLRIRYGKCLRNGSIALTCRQLFKQQIIYSVSVINKNVWAFTTAQTRPISLGAHCVKSR